MTNKPLTTEDWKILLALPWTAKDREIIDFFHKNGNQPTVPLKINPRLTVGSKVLSIGNMFRSHNLPYRLSADMRGLDFLDRPLKIFIIEW